MLNRRNISAYAAITAIMALSACGYDEQLISITVAPAVAVRTANSNNNSVQFTAAGNYSVSCPPNSTTYSCNPSITKPLTNPTWSTSDAANTAIDAKGLATCVSPTPVPAKIIASSQGTNGLIAGSAKLTCN